MGCAQAKPGWDDLIDSYRDDYPSDPGLQALEANLTTGAYDVMKMSSGLDRFKQSILYLRNSDQKVMETIMSCKKQILDAGGDVATKIENILDKFLIIQYFENSDQTLQLCQTHLRDFILKADKVASCIEGVVRERGSAGSKVRFNTAKEEYRYSAEVIVEEVVSLQKKHLKLLNELKTEFKKLDRKLKRIRTFRKVVHVIFMGVLSGIFAFGIMAAVMAVPGVAAAMSSHQGVAAFIVTASGVAQASSSGIQVGKHWLLTMIGESESTLKQGQNLIRSMESGTMDAIKVLDDIMRQVDQVIATGKDPQLSDLSSANEGPVYNLDAMEKFRKEIKKLNETREECIPVIETARLKVDVEYTKLKEMLAQSKRKSKK